MVNFYFLIVNLVILMKKMQKLMLVILGMSIILACDSNQHEGNINLNNGEKWKVNNEMKPHIKNGSELLIDFVSSQDTDYLKLANELKDQNNALIQSCTMDGESHDELHKWLHPHMQLIEELGNAKDFNEAESIIVRLEDSFKIYTEYFE